MDKKVVEQVVRFCIQKYWGNEEWMERIWKRLSFESIAKHHFVEFVRNEDMKREEGGANAE